MFNCYLHGWHDRMCPSCCGITSSSTSLIKPYEPSMQTKRTSIELKDRPVSDAQNDVEFCLNEILNRLCKLEERVDLFIMNYHVHHGMMLTEHYKVVSGDGTVLEGYEDKWKARVE